MFQTEFEFTLPRGYYDGEGNLHRQGVMRLAKAIDEITPMRDPRVKANPAYATVIVLSRVIKSLGALSEIGPAVIEDLYAIDLNYLYNLYREINESDQAPPQFVSSNSTSQGASSEIQEEQNEIV